MFMQQISAVSRIIPKAFDRWLDNESLLRAISGFAINTSPKKLGPMTVSVLSGKHGLQAKEMDRLLEYLESIDRPDVVSITNSMLSAIAPEVKRRLNVPVICALQGEESFIDAMPAKYADLARELMRKNAQQIDKFIAPVETYAQKMQAYLNVDADKIAVVPPGIDTGIYARSQPRSHSPFVVGYLSVINRHKGLDILVEAFGKGLEQSKLIVAGRVLDKGYWKRILDRVKELGISDRFEYWGEVELTDKLRFMEECSVFVLPTRIQESRGIVVMEAMAKGLPVVVPRSGIFAELVHRNSAGLLVETENPGELREALLKLMKDSKTAEEMAANARMAVRREYSQDVVADIVLTVYEELLSSV